MGRGFVKSKRGISAMMYISLFIVMILTAVFAAWIWINMSGRAGQAIQIQSVDFTDSETVIYVQNVGQGTVTMNTIYIDQQQFNVDSSNCIVNNIQTNTVLEGQTAAVTIDQAYQGTIHVKAIASGVIVEGDWKKTV